MRLKLAIVLVLAARCSLAQDRQIDVKRSSITIHVGKAGLLSVAGHEHWISAPIASGVISETAPQRVAFKVESAKLEVKPDPKVDAKSQAAIQKDMQEMTLETGKFPEIAFRSTQVDSVAEGQWTVAGMLMLHGVSKPVSLRVTRDGETYKGHTAIRQTAFAITPVRVGGGMIRIKDQIDIDFQIFASR